MYHLLSKLGSSWFTHLQYVVASFVGKVIYTVTMLWSALCQNWFRLPCVWFVLWFKLVYSVSVIACLVTNRVYITAGGLAYIVANVVYTVAVYLSCIVANVVHTVTRFYGSPCGQNFVVYSSYVLLLVLFLK